MFELSQKCENKHALLSKIEHKICLLLLKSLILDFSVKGKI